MISQQTIMEMKSQLSPRGTEPDIYFEGLPDGVGQWDVFQLVQNIGKQLGLNGTAIGHLHYLVSHTYDVDWRPGAAPIVYRTVMSTAVDRGITERTVRNIEEKLHKAGLLQWKDREDHKRYGQRRGTAQKPGPVMFAFGVDLSPLARQYETLLELNKQHFAYKEAFADLRRKVSNLRTRIRRKIKRLEAWELDVSAFTDQFEALSRINASMSLDAMSEIYNQAQALSAKLDDMIQDQKDQLYASGFGEKTDDGRRKISGEAEKNFRRLQPTLSPQSIDIDCSVDDDRDEVCEISSSGVENISYAMAVDAASDEFLECLTPTRDKINDLVSAASRMCHRMGIGRHAWMKACAVMGDTAAAVAVIIIDRNRSHPLIPVVNPGGVLRGMTDKAKAGDLHLDRSLFGILARDRDNDLSLRKG